MSVLDTREVAVGSAERGGGEETQNRNCLFACSIVDSIIRYLRGALAVGSAERGVVVVMRNSRSPTMGNVVCNVPRSACDVRCTCKQTLDRTHHTNDIIFPSTTKRRIPLLPAPTLFDPTLDRK